MAVARSVAGQKRRDESVRERQAELTRSMDARPQPAEPRPLIEVLLGCLEGLGVREAFGLVGGAIAPMAHALARGGLRTYHFRHEGGAGFAAVEASLASGRPTVLFTTTGPGLLNALTPMSAGRWEGARVVLLSGATPAAQRGRWACQETSSLTLPQTGLFTSGPLFHYATTVEHPAQLHSVCTRLAAGLGRPEGFMAHVSLPLPLQTAPVQPPPVPSYQTGAPGCEPGTLRLLTEALREREVVLWVGYGARNAAAEVRALAERVGAPVMLSPRAKGLFPEHHPLYLGTTGLGGHASVEKYFLGHRPEHVLVLGSRLSEPTSFWDERLVPTRGFFHVDVDPEVPGSAYPHVPTVAVQAELKGLLRQVLEQLPVEERRAPREVRGPPEEAPLEPRAEGPVRPRVLMERVQARMVDGSDVVVMTESGNAFAWGNHHLRFDAPGRYRVSTGFGSMGHMTSGVVGASLALGRKVVAIVGDGSMLMNNEVSTAVQYKAPAVWIVLNDAQYSMVEQGMTALGLQPLETALPRTDFVGLARAVGADGVCVEHESQLDAALEAALAAEGPFVVDVVTDTRDTAPWMRRIQGLIAQGVDAPSKGGAR
jgi:acetolactate synthase-1/2/3 large subunit